MYSYTLSLTLTVSRVGGQRHASTTLASGSILRKAGWSPGPVWTGAENVAFSGIRFPGRTARSESPY